MRIKLNIFALIGIISILFLGCGSEDVEKLKEGEEKPHIHEYECIHVGNDELLYEVKKNCKQQCKDKDQKWSGFIVITSSKELECQCKKKDEDEDSNTSDEK